MAKTHLPVSVAMAGSSEGGTAESGRARALNSTPAHSARANNVATFTPSVLPYPKTNPTDNLVLGFSQFFSAPCNPQFFF